MTKGDLEFRLNTENLGTVFLNLRFCGKEVQMNVLVESPTALSAFESQSSNFISHFQNKGFFLSSMVVKVNYDHRNSIFIHPLEKKWLRLGFPDKEKASFSFLV